METTEVKLSKHRVGRNIVVGQKFGDWTIVSYHSIKNGKAKWVCMCKCGKEAIVFQQGLLKGSSTSCGCYRDNHGDTRENPEYVSWACMKSRCLNPKHREYHNYGGRGIKICERWLKYSNFLLDMGRIPEGKNTIERINNNGDYEPANCRWASIQEQLRNRRNTIFVEFNGERKPLVAWCEEFGVDYNLIYKRKKYGLKRSFQEQFNNIPLCKTRLRQN